MPVAVIVVAGGDSDGVRERCAVLAREHGGTVTRFDLEVDHGTGLVASATTRSLFGGPQVLVAAPARALDADLAEQLRRVPSDTLVLLSDTTAPTAALRRALGDTPVETLTLPTAQDAAVRVRDLASGLGLTCSADVLHLLTKLAPDNWPRVRATLTEMATMGLQAEDARTVAALMGTAAARTPPWAVTDALARGDLRAALHTAQQLEPVVVTSWLSSHTTQLALALEGGGDSRVLNRARTLGAVRVGVSMTLIRDASVAVRTSAEPQQVVTVLIGRLWALEHAS